MIDLELLRRGLATMPNVRNVEKALIELSERLNDPDVRLFVEDGGFLIAEACRSEFSNAVGVIHVYAEKPGALKKLLKSLTDFADESGLDRIHGIDINQSPAYQRLFKAPGWKARPTGTHYEFMKHV